MAVRTLTAPEDLERYEAWVKAHPDGSLWQSPAWKTCQEALGRETRVYVAEEAGAIVSSALVTIDRTAFGLSVWEIPRGPLAIKNYELRIMNELMEKIVSDAKKAKAITLLLSPLQEKIILNSQFLILNSKRHIHPEATLHIDLTRSDEDILAGMHPKGRYNIKVAERNGVTIERSTDVGAFHRLALSTGGRDGFTVHAQSHYATFLRALPGSFLLLAYAGESAAKEPVAGLLGVIWNGTGIYYYGASSHAHRALMAPSLLQWEAMRLCKADRCSAYDLFGIAPPQAPAGHPWAGITGFKRKFGGTVVMYPAEQQVTLRPFVHSFLHWKRRLIG